MERRSDLALFHPGLLGQSVEPVEARRREMNGTMKRLKQKDKKKERAGGKKDVWRGGEDKKKREERGRQWLCALKPDRSGISKDKPS